jgi:SAM-dependent methyltransferase
VSAPTPEWFDDEEFWAAFYPFMFQETRFAAAEAEAETLLQLTQPSGNAVLDLCCGPGRFSAALARRGFRVTGVDSTEFLLAKARALAASEGLNVEWVREDMRRFVRPQAFDLVINMFTSFGYFDDKGEDLAVLRHIHESLRPGGVFLIDVMGKERIARVFQPTTSEELPDGTLRIQRVEVFDDWTRLRNEWLLIRGETVRRFRFHHTLYSGQELRTLLEQAGFPEVRLYGSLTGEPYGPEWNRLLAVARKSA